MTCKMTSMYFINYCVKLHFGAIVREKHQRQNGTKTLYLAFLTNSGNSNYTEVIWVFIIKQTIFDSNFITH